MHAIRRQHGCRDEKSSAGRRCSTTVAVSAQGTKRATLPHMAEELVGSPIAHELRPWVAKTVRLGYVAKGVIYLLIGTLAFRLGAGLDGGRLLNPDGALRIVMRQPLGMVLIGVIAVGILTYCAWQFIEGLWDTRRKGRDFKALCSRALTIIKGAAYGTVGWQALRFLLGSRGASNKPDDVAADVIRLPLGDVFLLLVGAGVAIYGLFEIWDACRADLGEDIDSHRMQREAGRWAVLVGLFGNGARGVILATMGGALALGALQHEPSKAGGVADALSMLIGGPFGVYFVAVVGAGLACFGVFELLHARYARL